MKIYRSINDVPYFGIESNSMEEKLEAFKTILRQMFEQYPPSNEANIAAGSQTNVEICRSNSLDRDTPLRVCYWALDTGVPNDDIIAIYTLLFG